MPTLSKEELRELERTENEKLKKAGKNRYKRFVLGADGHVRIISANRPPGLK
jgi:hypothetical protein